MSCNFMPCVFMSCNFMSCNFDGPSFSCPSFSVNPRPLISLPGRMNARHTLSILNSSVFIIQFSLYALVDPSRLIAVGDRSFATAGPRPETVFLTTSHRLHCCQCSVVNWRRTCFDSHTQTLLLRRTSSNIKFNWSWYTGRWWVGCYIWYSEEGSVRSRSPPRPLLVVPNVTAHPLTASVSITVLLCNGSLLCGFNVPIKG